jgi:cell division protein ZapB
MISDFKHLLEKVQQLAELSASLRRENADLRHRTVSLQADNAQLTQRMQEAHERVVAVMRRLPQEASTDISTEEPE